MCTPSAVKLLLPRGGWTTSVDLSQAFCHVPVHVAFRRFLGFRLAGRFYRFRAMPFGACFAPRVFTKLLAPVLGLLRAHGISVIAYLDDLLIWHATQEGCRLRTARVLAHLAVFGFLVNFPKSRLTPLQRFVFLGILWDLPSLSWGVPEPKQLECLSRLRSFGASPTTSRRSWESLVGFLHFLAPLFPQGRLALHDLIRIMNSHTSASGRDVVVPVPRAVRRCLL